jgi:hypothetical protein
MLPDVRIPQETSHTAVGRSTTVSRNLVNFRVVEKDPAKLARSLTRWDKGRVSARDPDSSA